MPEAGGVLVAAAAGSDRPRRFPRAAAGSIFGRDRRPGAATVNRCLLIAFTLVSLGCHRQPPAAPSQPQAAAAGRTSEYASERGQVQVTELVTGLAHPWALAFLPDGSMLVTERPGFLRRIGADGAVSAPLAGVPEVYRDGQAGLLDVALSPQFGSDRLVYLAYAEPSLRGNLCGTAVARARLEDDALVDLRVVYRQEPKLSAGTHVGTRLVFDDDGFLWVTQGDNRQAKHVQDLGKLQGKLVRIHPDGAHSRRQPLRGPRRCAPGDLVHRPPQHAGRGAAPGHAAPVDARARAHGWRRDQPAGGRQELRLAAGRRTASTTRASRCRARWGARRRAWSRRTTSGRSRRA